MNKPKNEKEAPPGIRKVQVTLGGHPLSIKTDAEDGYIQTLAKDVETLVNQLRQSSRGAKEPVVLLLACLGLANERATLKADLERLLAENAENQDRIEKALADSRNAAKREDEKRKEAEFHGVELRDRIAEIEADAAKSAKRIEGEWHDKLKALQKETDRSRADLGAERKRASEAERAAMEQAAQAAEMKRRTKKSDEQTRRAEDLAKKAEAMRDDAVRRMEDLQERLKASESRSRQVASRLVALEDKIALLESEKGTAKPHPRPDSHGHAADAAPPEVQGRMKEALLRILSRVDSAVEEIERLKQEGM